MDELDCGSSFEMRALAQESTDYWYYGVRTVKQRAHVVYEKCGD